MLDIRTLGQIRRHVIAPHVAAASGHGRRRRVHELEVCVVKIRNQKLKKKTEIRNSSENEKSETQTSVLRTSELGTQKIRTQNSGNYAQLRNQHPEPRTLRPLKTSARLQREKYHARLVLPPRNSFGGVFKRQCAKENRYLNVDFF